jgi:hypothetical protein
LKFKIQDSEQVIEMLYHAPEACRPELIKAHLFSSAEPESYDKTLRDHVKLYNMPPIVLNSPKLEFHGISKEGVARIKPRAKSCAIRDVYL